MSQTHSVLTVAVWCMVPFGFSVGFAIGALWRSCIEDSKRRDREELILAARESKVYPFVG